jgi:hypothetical protein
MSVHLIMNVSGLVKGRLRPCTVPGHEGQDLVSGQPVADGHRIEELDWTGRLDDLGRLWFDLTLRTAAYDEAGSTAQADEPDDQPDWEAPIVWNNYHRCTISSTLWEDATGLLAATPGRPFLLADAKPTRLTADPLPMDDLDAEPAFHVYLLGHDSVADHTIIFTGDGTGGHSIDWSGRIALTYAGDETFSYEFRAEIEGARLEHVTRLVGTPDHEATRRVSHLLGLPERLAAPLLTNA